MKTTLTDAELIQRCNEWVDKLCSTGGRAWSLRVPADHNIDPDLLFTELSDRLAVRNEEIRQLTLIMEGLKQGATYLREELKGGAQ